MIANIIDMRWKKMQELEEMLESMTQSILGDEESEKKRMSLGTAQADARDAVHNYIFKRGGRIPRTHEA